MKEQVSGMVPWFFVIVLFVGYFIFAWQLKATVNDEVEAAYRIQHLQVNGTKIEIGQGQLTEEPMLFLEYNFQAVLSMRDTLYMGQYALESDSILGLLLKTTDGTGGSIPQE